MKKNQKFLSLIALAITALSYSKSEAKMVGVAPTITTSKIAPPELKQRADVVELFFLYLMKQEK